MAESLAVAFYRDLTAGPSAAVPPTSSAPTCHGSPAEAMEAGHATSLSKAARKPSQSPCRLTKSPERAIPLPGAAGPVIVHILPPRSDPVALCTAIIRPTASRCPVATHDGIVSRAAVLPKQQRAGQIGGGDGCEGQNGYAASNGDDGWGWPHRSRRS